MNSDEFKTGLQRLEDEARAGLVGVMCAEAQWWRCHRRLIADKLVVGGWRVLHLNGRGGLDEHALTEFAHVDSGLLTYPSSAASST
jgi:uncharacterized protein (DUF488 family)